MERLAEIRARAKAHEEEIDSAKWYTVSDLAARWQLSETTVRAIPLSELRFKEFGSGAEKKRRRYKGEWVDMYENSKAA